LHQINKMKKRFYKFIFFKLMGWKIEGSVNSEIKKCVFMVMPHTSWHDFYLGVFTRGILGIDINFVAKKELFDSVFGFYFKYMGGEPLDRTGGLNKVEAIAKIFERKEIFKLGISPEGTRKKVTELKSGFYFIALKANVPIIPVAFNYGQKSVQFGKPFFPTGNFESDLKVLENHFLGVKGKFPENGFDVKK
jgi:1-acyl-sn-glycerol-3-phosphate acyltransferase